MVYTRTLCCLCALCLSVLLFVIHHHPQVMKLLDWSHWRAAHSFCLNTFSNEQLYRKQESLLKLAVLNADPERIFFSLVKILYTYPEALRGERGQEKLCSLEMKLKACIYSQPQLASVHLHWLTVVWPKRTWWLTSECLPKMVSVMCCDNEIHLI